MDTKPQCGSVMPCVVEVDVAVDVDWSVSGTCDVSSVVDVASVGGEVKMMVVWVVGMVSVVLVLVWVVSGDIDRVDVVWVSVQCVSNVLLVVAAPVVG